MTRRQSMDTGRTTFGGWRQGKSSICNKLLVVTMMAEQKCRKKVSGLSGGARLEGDLNLSVGNLQKKMARKVLVRC